MLRHRSIWIVLYGVTLVAFAWVWAAMPVMAIPAATTDDARFVGNAGRILSGAWLGPYDHYTLAKGSGFSIWLALLAGIGVSALLGQALLYAGAALLLVRALSAWIAHEGARYALFLLLLCNPGLYDQATLRIMREGFYTPTLLLIFALLLWWVRLTHAAPRPRLLAAAALGFALGFFYLTREETVWILPFLLSCIVLRIVTLWRIQAWRNDAMAALVCAVAAGLPILTVSALNARFYGFFGTVEFREPAFISAYASLARLGPDEPSLIVLPRAVLPALFAASPAAAELRPYFDTRRGGAFLDVGCATYGVSPCDEEFRAAWFMWAVRDAAWMAGHHTSAPPAAAYYARLADEVDAACDRGELACQPKNVSLAPPFRAANIAPSLQAMWRVWRVATGGVTLPPALQVRSIYFGPNEWHILHSAFLDFVGAHVYIDVIGSHPAQAATPEYLRFSLGVQRAQHVLRGLGWMISAWSALGWLFALVGLISLLAVGVLWLWAPVSACWPLFWVCCGGWVLFSTRVVLLGYLDTVAIPSVNMLYLSPAMPYLVLSCGLAIFLLVRSLRILTRA